VSELLQSPLFWKVLSAAGIPICLWLGLWRLKVARTITDTPMSRVRSAAQGYVEVSGIARTFEGKANAAPLTLLPSVWWYYRIEQAKDSNDRDGWRTIRSDTSDANFLLHDDSGHCVVDPQGAEVFPAIRKVWYGSQDWPAPELGTGNHLTGLFHRYRYTEHHIPHESVVNVIGEFRSLGNGPSVDDEVAELTRKWKSDQPELLRRFDTNRDGVINADEWEQARRTARECVLHELANAPPQPVLNMLAKPGDGRPFLVAGVDLGKVARRAQLQALAAAAGFVVCAGLFAWLVTNY
jgi:hypothetical protein